MFSIFCTRAGDSTTCNPPTVAASPIQGLDNVERLALHFDVLGGDGYVLVVTVTDFDLIVEATAEPGEIYELRSSAKNLVAASGESGSEKWNPWARSQPISFSSVT